MTTRKPLAIGPFSRGLNTFDDATAIHDQEVAEALNFDPGLDGSLKSRPPFTDVVAPLPLGVTGTPQLIGYYYSANGLPYLIASDGNSSTWQYSLGTWTLITNTFAASDMAQYDGKAWLVSPVGETDPGGYWTPEDGFTADSDMPHGTSITTYKSRLWIAEGIGGSNPTRVRYSKVLGQPDFWDNPGFSDIGSGDGQNIVKIVTYFDVMLVFRTKSIWSFQYGIDPATAIQGVIVPGVGLQNKNALVSYENYLYFMFDEKAYSFINNRVQQINIKVPFRTLNPGSTTSPYSVSLFNNRVLYSYYENIYVYSLRTQTWTTWRSDAWGPIGQLLMPYVNDDTDIAYALPSGTLQPGAVAARNRAPNPSFEVDTSFWATSTGMSNAERVTNVPGSAHCLKTTLTATSGQARAENMPISPGESPKIKLKMRLDSGTANGIIRIHYITGGTQGSGNGTFSDPVDSPPVALDSSSWTELEFEPSVAAASGETMVRIYPRIEGGTVGQIVYVDDLIWDTSSVDDYFDGGTPPDDGYRYEWDGEEGKSTSSKVLDRAVTLLKIEDRTTEDSEEMTCVLQTKNYNFEVPGSFKVLFWWGLDAIFKVSVKGQVVPGVFNLSTTWGQIANLGVTWGQLLMGTWAHPYLSDPSEVSDVSTGPGPSRKFVKFFKKLRFRQIYFRVSFQIDGSSATGPVQIFSLSAYVQEKQTVSKTVS